MGVIYFYWDVITIQLLSDCTDHSAMHALYSTLYTNYIIGLLSIHIQHRLYLYTIHYIQ